MATDRPDGSFGPFVLNRERQTLMRADEVLPVGHRGYLILEALVDANGQTVSKAALLERAWPGIVVEDANLTVQIGALRKAMGTEGEALIVTVPRAGYRLVRPEPAATPAPARPAAATIAVLPFANMSGDVDQDYFADGIVDELITALSRFKTFAVVSRNSSFTYKGRAVDVREAGRELGVRYILEGGVRRSGPRLRVSAQLIDAETGAHLWAEKFEGGTEDIFSFQDSITESVIGLVEPAIRKTEIERARRKPPRSTAAYDLFLKAIPLIYGMEAKGYAEALALLEMAIGLDPGFAPAIAYAAWAVEKLNSMNCFDEPTARARGIPLARMALEKGRDDPLISVLSGYVMLSIDVDFRGVEIVRHGLAGNPNNLVALNLGGTTNLIAGDFDAAAACYERAYRLSPGAPDAFWSLTGLGWVELERGNDLRALDWFDLSLATGNEWAFTYLGVIAALALSGQDDKAQSALRTFRRIAPGYSMENGTGRIRTSWKRLRQGLMLAGMSDE